MNACNCKGTLGNTGIAGSNPIQGVTRKLYYTSYFDNDGNINSIDTTIPIDQAFLDAKLNHVDPTKRWFPSPDIENIEDVRGDAVFETLNNGQNVKVQTGTRSFTGMVVKGSPNFADKISGYGCVKLGAFIIDDCGSIIGNGSITGILKPIRINEFSWNSGLIKGTDSTTQKVPFRFDWHHNERDEDLRMILSSEITAVLLDGEGLIDVSPVYSSPTTTSVVFIAKTAYGSHKNPIRLKGLVLGDMTAYNVNNSLAVTLLTLTETVGNGGQYTATYAAQTSADAMRLGATKTGYSFTDFDTTTYVTP